MVSVCPALPWYSLVFPIDYVGKDRPQVMVLCYGWVESLVYDDGFPRINEVGLQARRGGGAEGTGVLGIHMSPY